MSGAFPVEIARDLGGVRLGSAGCAARRQQRPHAQQRGIARRERLLIERDGTREQGARLLRLVARALEQREIRERLGDELVARRLQGLPDIESLLVEVDGIAPALGRDARGGSFSEQPGEVRERARAQIRIAAALGELLGERAPVEVFGLFEMAAVVLDHRELRERMRVGSGGIARGAQLDQALVDRRGEVAAADGGVVVGLACERARVGLRRARLRQRGGFDGLARRHRGRGAARDSKQSTEPECGSQHPRLIGRAAPAVDPRLRGVPRQPDAAELPARVGVEEVAVARADVIRGRRARSAAQHDLVAHELAVVLAERARRRRITGVGRVGAARPLPDVSE